MTKTKNPIDSFSAELFNALVEGSRRPLEMELPYRNAIRLRQRIHKLRSQMREEGHALYGLVLKAELLIDIPPNTPVKTVGYRNAKVPLDPNSTVKLTIQPRDIEFIDAITKAGVKVQPLTPDDTTEQATTPPDLETLLKDLK